MGETTHGDDRAPIPAAASLKVDPDRLEQMWALRPAERIQAALDGRFTLGEMLRWASRRPSEPPLVDGEWFFISAYLADSIAGSPANGQAFWDGEYTPLPATREVSRTMPAAAGDTSTARSC